MSSARVVLFGGTFDPVHLGHLAVATQVVTLLGVDSVTFLVANTPGERKDVHAPAATRLAMVRAAVDADPRFSVDDREIRRGGITYTADTMDALHAETPDTEFDLLIGADSARAIRAWRHGGALLNRERFVIVNRAGTEPLTRDDAVRLGYDTSRTTLLHIDSPPVSASDIRLRAARGLTLAGLVPPPVEVIIRRERLYADVSGGA